MFKKMTVLAMALGVVAAMALPATASAFWTHNHQQIQQDVDVSLTGQVGFSVPGQGAVHCQITSTVTFFAGQTTGQVDTFERDPASGGTDTNRCSGSGGLVFCQIHDLTPLELPWQIHTVVIDGKPAVDVTFKEITSQGTGGFCPANHITVTPGTAIFTPDNAQTTNTLTLEGQTKVHVLGEATATITGHLEVEAPNRDTYGI